MEENGQSSISVGNRRYLNYGEDVDLRDPQVVERLQALESLVTDVEQRTGQKFDSIINIIGEYGYSVQPHMDAAQPSQLSVGTFGWLSGELKDVEGILLHEAGHAFTRNVLAYTTLAHGVIPINHLDAIEQFMRVDPVRAHGWLLETYGSISAAEKAIDVIRQFADQQPSLMAVLQGKTDREIFQILREDPTYIQRAAEQVDTELLTRLYTNEALKLSESVSDLFYQNPVMRAHAESIHRLQSPEYLDEIFTNIHPLRHFEDAPPPDKAFFKLASELAIYKDAAVPVLATQMAVQRAEEYLVDHFAIQHAKDPEAYLRSLAAIEHAENDGRAIAKAHAGIYDIDLSTHPLIPERVELGRQHIVTLANQSDVKYDQRGNTISQQQQHTRQSITSGPDGHLTITPERFPNLKPQQIEQLRTIGPLPEYVYRGSPPVEYYPMNTRAANWGRFLEDSVDATMLPAASATGERSLLYVGDMNTALGYSGITDRDLPDANGHYRPADSFSLEELHQMAGGEQPIKDFALEQKQFYRISTADIISRLTPEAVIVRDTGQQGKSWAVVGELTENVPTSRIQYVGDDAEGQRVFLDVESGYKAKSITGITQLESPPTSEMIALKQQELQSQVQSIVKTTGRDPIQVLEQLQRGKAPALNTIPRLGSGVDIAIPPVSEPIDPRPRHMSPMPHRTLQTPTEPNPQLAANDTGLAPRAPVLPDNPAIPSWAMQPGYNAETGLPEGRSLRGAGKLFEAEPLPSYYPPTLPGEAMTANDAVDVAPTASGNAALKVEAVPQPVPSTSASVKPNTKATAVLATAANEAVPTGKEVAALADSLMEGMGEAEKAALKQAALSGKGVMALARLGKLVPVIGAAPAGAIAGYTLYQAYGAYERGELSGNHLSKIAGAASAYAATGLGGFVTGLAAETTIDEGLKAAGVPEKYRFGTMREPMLMALRGMQDHAELNRLKDQVPQPTVDAFNAGLRDARGPTNDAALNDYLSVRDAAFAEAQFGTYHGARVGYVPVDPAITQAKLDAAARTYLALGGTLETAQHALGEDPGAARLQTQMRDLIDLVPGINTQGVYPSADANLEKLKALKIRSEKNPSQAEALRPEMEKLAEAYLQQGNTPRDALVSYYRFAPFSVSEETVSALEGNKQAMKLLDGSDGSKRDAILSAVEIGQGMTRLGIYGSKADSNKDGMLDAKEAITAILNPQEFKVNKPSPSR